MRCEKVFGSWRFLIQLRKLVWPWSHLNQIGDSTTNISLSGTLAMYELRAGKVQLLTAHTGPIIAVAFSSDGKNLASYSVSDNKLHFWQTSTGMFGLGNAQTKCTRFVGPFESSMPHSKTLQVPCLKTGLILVHFLFYPQLRF